MAFSAQNSVSGTLVASTQQTFTFGYNANNTAIRYAYVVVENTGTAGVIYARTDGTAATVGGDFCTAIDPGTYMVIANMLPLWTQTSSVLVLGSYPAGSVVESGTPPEIQPYGSSLWGGQASPGTSVSVISGGTPTFTITGTG